MEQTIQLMTASAETCQLIQGWDKQAKVRMKEERQRADHPQATAVTVSGSADGVRAGAACSSIWEMWSKN